MKELLLILLGIGVWQSVVALTVFTTDDEEKVFKIGIGIIGWIIYGVVMLFVKITKYYAPENQTKRLENQAKKLVKSAKKRLKKSKKNWLKWYKKYGKYSYETWNIARKNNVELFEQMTATGFDYNNSKEV